MSFNAQQTKNIRTYGSIGTLELCGLGFKYLSRHKFLPVLCINLNRWFVMVLFIQSYLATFKLHRFRANVTRYLFNLERVVTLLSAFFYFYFLVATRVLILYLFLEIKE